MSLLGETIGPYTLEDVLGEGGMGRVYRAYDRRLDRHVAIKHIHPQVAHNETHRARFRREAWAVARLNHPAIVHIYDILENDHGDWIVMELVEGPSLRSMLSRGPIDPAYAVAYGRQIAEGLAEAHDKGIIHRDLKTENVLVAPSGQAKILDFGLAKPLVRRADEQTLSVTGTVIGTCRSMSPEQAQGFEVDPRSDLFSLGTLLYEIATGRSPFKAATSTKTLARVISHHPDPAYLIDPHVPKPLSELIGRLHEKLPSKRPLNAAVVAAELAQLEHGKQQPKVSGPRAQVEDHVTMVIEPEVLDSAEWTSPNIPQERKPALSRVAVVKARSRVFVLGFMILLALGVVAFWWFGRGGAIEPGEPPELTPQVSTVGQDLDVDALLQDAQTLLARYDKPGHLEAAIENFQRILGQDANNAAAYAGLARAYLFRFYIESRDPAWLDLALPAAQEAVEMDSVSASAKLSLGLVLSELGRADEARVELTQALVIDSTQAAAYAGLGDLYLSEGNLVEAERAYRNAIESDPSERRYQDLLGSLYYRQGRLDEASVAFERSIDLAPDAIFGYRNLSAVHASRGDYARATALLQRALAVRPHATLFSNLGKYLFLQGLYVHSARAFERALEMPGGANRPITWGNLGDAYRWMSADESKTAEAYRRAIQLLDEALVRQDQDPTLRSRRALYLARLGECDEARLALRDLPSTPRDAYLHYRMALTAESCGDRSEALSYLERAFENGYPLAEARQDPELFDLRDDTRYHRLAVRFEDSG